MATIEFYEGNKCLAVVEDSTVPRAITIRGVKYVVKRATWTVDHVDRILRARVVVARRR